MATQRLYQENAEEPTSCETTLEPSAGVQPSRRRFLRSSGATALWTALGYTMPRIAAANPTPGLSPTSFQDMSWDGVTVLLSSGGSFSHSATLNGLITVAPSGAPNGSVVVTFDDGSSATFAQTSSGATTITTGGHVLDLLTPNGPIDAAILDGAPVSLLSLMSGLQTDIQNNVTPSLMTLASRALLALSALGNTQPWCNNVQVARAGLFDINWCKVAVKVAVAAVIVGAATVCAGICVPGAVVTFGGIAVPCTALCAGATFLGAQAADATFTGAWNP